MAAWYVLKCDIKAVFNELLKNIGVKDTQVEEVYCLDEESLNTIKYGLPHCVIYYSEDRVDLSQTCLWTYILVQVEIRGGPGGSRSGLP